MAKGDITTDIINDKLNNLLPMALGRFENCGMTAPKLNA